ncbi:MAG TPA: RNA polymerase sigma factor [Solirubrobacteraceae bacterium]|jgi:RNA polymerase sigma factor (sigma-70 family)
MRPTELDRLVSRAQRGDAAALEELCARARPMLQRHTRRLLRGSSADVDDAVQEALILACARIGTYRWEGSFAGWLYAIATRSMLRGASRTAAEARTTVEVAERALVTEHDPMTEAEWSLVEQDLHLACTIGVLEGLSPEARRLYLLGEVLAVPDRVGAEVAQVPPATYRKRLERARRAVADVVRERAGGDYDPQQLATAARELDDLARLGELHRAHARGASAAGAVRALERVAPTLAT